MGTVAWGFTCSIDGVIAGPGHDMSGMSAAGPPQEGERDETTSEAYAGHWSGTEFILTHRPEELAGDPGVVATDCDVACGHRVDRELVEIDEDSARSFGRAHRPKGRRP